MLIGSCRQRENTDHIQPYHKNPRYWQYNQEPVMLIGGSKDDNLFQVPRLKAHLDLMKEVGANYIRNTMSSRDSNNVKAFKKLDNGKYDLDQWNEEYWQRFENMLESTAEREIFIQIELWDQWDHNSGLWNTDPWNPGQNVNYTVSNTRLKDQGYYNEIDQNSREQHDFFTTVPKVNNDTLVLHYQKQFVDKVLAHTLQYDHVLYTVTNELFNQHPVVWSLYWINHVRERAREAGKEIFITEMFQESDITKNPHLTVYDTPETFDYIDISQNSGQLNQQHWDHLQWVYDYISDRPRPLNHTKTYGGDQVGWTDGDVHGIERFWRSIIGGAASVRFHRPPSGIGLNDKAQTQIRSARMLLNEFDIFQAQPDANSSKLVDRDSNEAYLSYIQGEQYTVYFPKSGSVGLKLSDVEASFELKWLNINASSWSATTDFNGSKTVPLETPGEGSWVAFITRK